MAVPVAAILKKVAVAVGSNKKVLKTVCGIVLGIIFIVLMPIIALLGIFSGDTELDIDTEPIYGWIEEGQTEFESVFREVEGKMMEAGFRKSVSRRREYCMSILCFDSVRRKTLQTGSSGALQKNRRPRNCLLLSTRNSVRQYCPKSSSASWRTLMHRKMERGQ